MENKKEEAMFGSIPYRLFLATHLTLEQHSTLNRNFRLPGSIIGLNLDQHGIPNTCENRSILSKIISIMTPDDEVASDCSPSQCSENTDCNLLTMINVLKNELQISTNFNVRDKNSIFGNALAQLAWNNTHHNREHVQRIYRQHFKTSVFDFTHEELTAALLSANSGEKALEICKSFLLNLRIPQTRENQRVGSLWIKAFSEKSTVPPTTKTSKSKIKMKEPEKNKKTERVSKNQPKSVTKMLQTVNPNVTEAVRITIATDNITSLSKAIDEFRIAIHTFAEHPCFICRRLQLKCNLVNFNVTKDFQNHVYTFEETIIPEGSKIDVCHRCKLYISARKPRTPAQAYYNSNALPNIPSEISKLSTPEIQLIIQIRPFMKIFHLCKGQGQSALKGSVIHFPNSVDELCEVLPLPVKDANFVIINETGDDISKAKEIIMRPEEVSRALIWLKQNNWLYKNIKIKESVLLEPEILTPRLLNITMGALNDLPNVPIETGFKDIGNSRRILRASINQSSSIFQSEARGIQCTAIAIVCTVYSFVRDPCTWTMSLLDQIMHAGTDYFLLKSPNFQMLTVLEAEGTIESVFGNVSIHITAHENESINGQLNKLLRCREATIIQTETSKSLVAGLDEFINGNFNQAILTVGDYSMGLIKTASNIYYFDSHSRGDKGGVAVNGVACLIQLNTSIASLEISKIVHRNLEPRRININGSEIELRNFIYNIVPLSFETDYLEEPNTNDSERSSQEIQTAAQLKSNTEGKKHDQVEQICNDAITFGNDGISDTMFHGVDAKVPDVKAVKDHYVTIHKSRGRPLYSNRETHLEELSFPQLFPHGIGGLSKHRTVQITPLDYFQLRVMSNETRFWNTSYLFYALSRMEEDRLKSKINICAQMYKGNDNECAENQEFPGLKNVHLYMSSIRGSAAYWKKYTGDLIAMIKQIGIPTLFITISSDDLNSTDSLIGLMTAENIKDESNQELLHQARKLIDKKSFDELQDLLNACTFQQKRLLLNNNPIQAARHFSHWVKEFTKLIKSSGIPIFGYPVSDYSYRVEFQNRGSGHIHMLVWLKDAPTDFSTEEGITFVDRNVTCRIPEDDDPLKNLVLKYQNHAHKSTCFKKGNKYCRFDFPRKISEITKVLNEDDTARNHGRFIILKRTPQETYINNYNKVLLEIVRCNMDIQVVTDANAVAYYIAKYISKAEPSDVQEEIQKIMSDMQQNRSTSAREMAHKISTKIMNQRQVGAPEAAFRLCHLPLRMSTRSFVFIPAYTPDKRLHIIRKETIGTENTTLGTSIIEKYMLRPVNLDQYCLLEFASLYKPKKKDRFVDEIDEDESDEEENHNSTEIRLENGTKMVLRKKPAVVKYPNFDIIKEKSDYYYCMMLLYLPFREENFITGFPNNMEAFRNKCGQFRKPSDSPIVRPDLAIEIDKALIRIGQLENLQSPLIECEGFDLDLEESEADQIPDPIEFFQPAPDVGDRNIRYHSLSAEQKEVYNLCKSVLDSDEKTQKLAYISGSGGTGKSYLIDTLTSLIAAYECDIKRNTLLKAAPTGIAALNISATTIHRAFKLPIQRGFVPAYTQLSSRQVEEMRKAYKNVEFIIIDEISMIPYTTLRTIHLRLCEIFDSDQPFGGKTLFLFGDLMQFMPVKGTWIFDPPSHLRHEQNLWCLFSFFELHTNHRQTGDRRYLELLERLRFGNCTAEDVKLLETRIFDSEDREDVKFGLKFADALSIYPNISAVNEFNNEQTKKLRERNPNIYKIKALDTHADGVKYDEEVADNLIPTNDRFTAGIPTTIELGVGSRIMLRRNLSLTDKLVNGSIGIVKGLVWTGLRREQMKDGDLPESIFVQFDGDMGGRKRDANGLVKIETVTLEFVGKRQTLIKRRMLPIVLCWALNFHKTQGLTLHYASVELAGRHFSKAMSYVALSRLKSLEGLHVIDKVKSSNILTTGPGKTPCDESACRELHRLRLKKIQFNGDMEEMLNWIHEFPTCCTCKKWICICICN